MSTVPLCLGCRVKGEKGDAEQSSNHQAGVCGVPTVEVESAPLGPARVSRAMCLVEARSVAGFSLDLGFLLTFVSQHGFWIIVVVEASGQA